MAVALGSSSVANAISLQLQWWQSLIQIKTMTTIGVSQIALNS